MNNSLFPDPVDWLLLYTHVSVFYLYGMQNRTMFTMFKRLRKKRLIVSQIFSQRSNILWKLTEQNEQTRSNSSSKFRKRTGGFHFVTTWLTVAFVPSRIALSNANFVNDFTYATDTGATATFPSFRRVHGNTTFSNNEV